MHDVPGTTRDAIDTLIETDEGPVRFIDTAGMRRRARIDSGTEYYSLVRALRAVDSADVALLVIDCSVGVTHQDQRLAERVDAAGCPIVILLNKWDRVGAEARRDLGLAVKDRLGFLGSPPVLRISALSGKGVTRLWPSLSTAVAEYRTRIPTRRVNEAVREAQSAHPAPGGARVLYATQVATDPPTFTLFANRTLPRTYLRYLERKLREQFDLRRHRHQDQGPSPRRVAQPVGVPAAASSSPKRGGVPAAASSSPERGGVPARWRPGLLGGCPRRYDRGAAGRRNYGEGASWQRSFSIYWLSAARWRQCSTSGQPATGCGSGA